MKRRLLRYAAVAAAALALVQGVRAVSDAAHRVPITYDAPRGELRVTIRDADDQLLRRAYFAPGVRQHVVELPTGRFTARLERGDGAAVIREFEVRGEAAIELRWW